MIRVGYIAGEPTSWRVPHLDLIADHPEIAMTVIYAAPTVQEREWTLQFRHQPRVLRGPSLPLSRVLHHDYPLTPQIWRVLDRGRFDVLVIGGWSLMATQLAIVWARLHRVPYLVISENHLRERRPAWVRRVKSVVLRGVIPPASGHLVTGTLAGDHARRYGARPDLVTVFPNTIDVPAYAEAAARLRPRRSEIRQALSIAADAVVVTTVCRLIHSKGVDELLEAVARARSLTAASFHVLVVGGGELRAALERRAIELELAVTFAGFRQGEALLECYAATDVFALFSRREPWGVVVNEAAAFSLPLILTEDVGASGDLLHNDENGKLVRSGDLEGQGRAIASLVEPEVRAQFGRRSLQLVESWGYEPSVETFVAAIRQALAERARQPPPVR